MPDCYLRVFGIEAGFGPGPGQVQGNKQQSTGNAERHGWNGWRVTQYLLFIGDVGAIAEGRAWWPVGGLVGSRRLPKQFRRASTKPDSSSQLLFLEKALLRYILGTIGGEHKRRAAGSIWKWRVGVL